jgi:hypothetical protein
MPVTRLIALNNNAGAYTDILATIPCKSIVFVEDDAAARTGIQVKTLLDNFATNNVYSATAEPVAIPDIASGYDHMRKPLGYQVNFIPTRAEATAPAPQLYASRNTNDSLAFRITSHLRAGSPGAESPSGQAHAAEFRLSTA